MSSLPKKIDAVTPDADYDVIVIGAGPAGLTAALYASRRALKTLVIAKTLGGQLAMTPSIENYPGTKQTSGVDLMMSFQEHAAEHGAQFAFETVTGLSKNGEVFTVEATGGARTARAVVLAFGLTPKNLEVPGEQEFQGKGVVYCATCDAPLFKKRDVVVVGGTYEALDAALLLAKLECNVTLVHAGSGFGAQKKLAAQVEANERIDVRLKTTPVRVEGEQLVSSLVIASEDGTEETLAVSGVFVELGHKIDSSWVGDLVERDKTQSILVDGEMATATPGLFACGDVTPQRDKQAVVSAGAGAVAALSAYHYLQKQIGKPVVRVDWAHSEDE